MGDRGAERIDLDAVSREVLMPGSPVLPHIAREFGADLVDPATGRLDRGLLAARAFASEDATRRLEDIELPAITQALDSHLVRLRAAEKVAPGASPLVCVVEVPLLDRIEEGLDRADEVICVTCPFAVRRERALGRGMTATDFEARARWQPTDAYLRAHATTEFPNDGDEQALVRLVDRWWRERETTRWVSPRMRNGGGDADAS